MSRRTLRALLRAALFAGACSPALAAAAKPTKSQCVDANTAGQSARLAGHLSEAREQLLVCSDKACPSIVRTDCIQRLEEIAKAQPTLVIGVKDRSGADVAAATVKLDGRLFTEKLDGTALPLDPGAHEIEVTLPGESAVTRKVVIKEGEKGRVETIAFAPKASATAQAVGPEAAPAPMSAQKILAITTGGLGILGAAAGAVFGGLAFSAAAAQKEHCASATNCADHAQALDDHRTAEAMGTASTVAFAVAGALLVAAPVLYLTDRGAKPKTASVTVRVGVSPGASGLSVGGRF